MSSKEGKLRKLFRRAKKDFAKSPNGREAIETNQVGVQIMPPGLFVPEARERGPVLGSPIQDVDKRDEFTEDPEILKLQLILVQRTPQNLKWAFKHDNACKTATFILAHAIHGAAGPIAKTEDEDFKKYVEKEYLPIIKPSKIIENALADNFTHAESVWWLDYNQDEKAIIPKQIDYLTLTPVDNKFDGNRKWIQYTYIDRNMPKSSKGTNWKTYEPSMDYFHTSQFWQEYPRDRAFKKNILQDDVLWFNFFDSPPLVTVLEVIVWKKWMQSDSKLSGQKYATPTLDASIELPESYDLSSDETSNLCDRVAEDLRKLMNFGVLSHPKNVEIKALETNGNAFDFVKYLEYADKMIHKTFFTPVALVEASGSELATSRTIANMFSLSRSALKVKFVDLFEKLIKLQCEFVGRKVPEDFKLDFPDADVQQKMSANEEFGALMQLHNAGITRDENEVRAYVAKFGMEFDELTDEELMQKELQQEQANGNNGELPDHDLEKMLTTDSMGDNLEEKLNKEALKEEE